MKKNLLILMISMICPFIGIAQNLDIYGSVLGDNGPIANTEVSVYNSPSGNTLGDVLSTTTTDNLGFFSFYLNSQEATDIIGLATAACPENPSFIFNTPTGSVDTLYVALYCGTGISEPGEALFISGTPINNNGSDWFFSSSVFGEVESYTWSIEDQTYNTADVTYTFSEEGEYEVSLTALMTSGNELTESLTVYAFDSLGCEALFFPLIDSTSSEGIVFVNASYGSDLEFLWTFGDGSTSTEPYPTYVYTDSLDMEVCLSISSPTCSDSICMYLSEDIINGWLGAGFGGIVGKPGGKNPVRAKSSGFEFKVVPLSTGVLSTNVQALNVELGLYPNPSNGNFSLNLETENEETGLITVFDMSGRSVYQQVAAISQGSNVFNLSLNDLPGGMYILSYNGAMNVGTRKLVIRR